VGISGWNYPPWRGVFYPDGLTHKRELAFASRMVDSIEINGSFYSLVRPESVQRWYAETPAGFVFALKGSRFITHMKRLRDAHVALANFFASGVLALEDKLGPILWQLPPNLAFDRRALEDFFHALPRTTAAAVDLASRHDERLAGRAYVQSSANRPLRYALEVRHPSFHDPAFVALLRQHGVALCVADTAGLFPDFEDVTADFVYVRLHGHAKLYESGYPPRVLERWAERIRAWRAGGEMPAGGETPAARRASPEHPAPTSPGRDVYVYFDNDARVRAPFDARALRALLQGERAPRIRAKLAGAGEAARTTWPEWRARRPGA
jgi:uncharacterized protein YecE (DUF72 family)